MADHDRLERGLREHLDRPLPLAPGAAERVVAAVRARTAGRRRRSPLPVLAGLATGAVLTGVLGAALWSRAIAPPRRRRRRACPRCSADPRIRARAAA